MDQIATNLVGKMVVINQAGSNVSLVGEKGRIAAVYVDRENYSSYLSLAITLPEKEMTGHSEIVSGIQVEWVSLLSDTKRRRKS